jgi:hypothetical protein
VDDRENENNNTHMPSTLFIGKKGNKGKAPILCYISNVVVHLFRCCCYMHEREVLVLPLLIICLTLLLLFCLLLAANDSFGFPPFLLVSVLAGTQLALGSSIFPC